MLKNKTLRLVLASLFLVLACGMSLVSDLEAGGNCWMCVSYDLCGQTNFGSEDCTVTSGGHGCQYQCEELGDPCFS